ncbi:MAG TPA: TIM-barrel domain-containing protein [Phycisphaerales bacterium]
MTTLIARYLVASIVATAGLAANAETVSSLQAAGTPAAVSGTIGDRVSIHFADQAAVDAALPSLTFEKPRPAHTPSKGPFAVTPRFSKDGDKTTIRIAIDPDTSLYGTGSVSGPLLRNGRTVTLWNTDAYGYDDTNASLYQSHPWVLAVRPDGTAFGILIDSTFRMHIAKPSLAGGDIVITVDGGPQPPVVLIERNSPQEVVQALAQLTGTITMPPKWALGYHQCRYSYNPDSRVKEIAQGFRDRKIPLDVIWMDIDYMDQFRVFTFDEKQFPDPKGLNTWLKQRGVHNVWMIDPGIGSDKTKFRNGSYFVYEQTMAGNHAVQAKDGTTYQGEVWPGMCVFPDYLRKETRQWWATLYKDFMAYGIDGVWNDMNEPAVFNVKAKTMPEDNIHRADPELGGTGSHLQYHNVYGMFMVKASREGIMAANPDKRPFVLSRANFLGGHRYAATWTGDNSANWYHLENSVPMALNMGLSGQPFAGPDIGGFAGNGPKGQEGQLFARWMGFGAMLPFARGHTGKGNIDKEPWSFGPEVESTCRDAINRRMRFMPYFYTLFHEASINGMPVVRPTYWADLKDPALRSEDDSFLLGNDVLIVSDMVPDRTRAVAMPKGSGGGGGASWKQFDFTAQSGADNPEKADPDLPKLYIRPGAIVPISPVMQYVDEKPLDTLTLLVNLDGNGKAVGTLYEDAGDGWSYKQGDYLLTTYAAEKKGNEITVSVSKTEGKRERPARTVVVQIAGTNVSATGTDSQPIKIATK